MSLGLQDVMANIAQCSILCLVLHNMLYAVIAFTFGINCSFIETAFRIHTSNESGLAFDSWHLIK